MVGIVGVISFLRHGRSDAKRMGWDYGKRNDFQRLVLPIWPGDRSHYSLGPRTLQAQGALLLVFGIYMALAAVFTHRARTAASKVTHRRFLLVACCSLDP